MKYMFYLYLFDSVHSNLKSSNILLGSIFESFHAKYALIPYLYSTNDVDIDAATKTTTSALFYTPLSPTTPVRPPSPYGPIQLQHPLLELLISKTLKSP